VTAYSLTGRSGAIRVRVLRFIAALGELGATDDEVQNFLPMGQNTQRPRRRELEVSGYIMRSDMKRMTLSGRLAYAYVATPKGQAWIREDSAAERTLRMAHRLDCALLESPVTWR
jgi:hypothetical protein